MKRWILYIVLGLIVFYYGIIHYKTEAPPDGFSLISLVKLAPIAH